MEVSEHIAALGREGDLLAAAASRVEPDRPVPTCPDWQLRDLVRHTGSAHRWAAAIVTQPSPQPIPAGEEVTGPMPDDHDLVDWYRESLGTLVAGLEAAEPDVACWSFLPAPSPLAFWARRQAHETGIHRVDAESAGGAVTPFPADFAVDGLDELLCAFVVRPGGKLRSDPPRRLHLHARDTGDDWLVDIGPDHVTTTREKAAADCSVSGPASDLHLLMWNRRTAEGLDVDGDAGLLDLWRESVRIRFR